MEIGGHRGAIDGMAFLIVFGMVVCFGMYGIMDFGQFISYILHNIHLAALGPFAIGIVGGHHPNSGPSAYSIGQFGAHLYPAIFPFGKTLGGNAGRGNRGNRRAAGRIDRRLPLFGEQSVLYHRTVATNHDVQIAVLPIAVLGTGYRVIL